MPDRSRRGAALVVVALACTVIVPLSGLALDAVSLYLIRARLSAAADAAALAGARSLSTGADLASQRANAILVATRYFRVNFPLHYWGTSNDDASISVAEDNTTHLRSVTVTAYADAPLYFMRLIDSTSPTVRVTTVGRRRDVNVMLVLDRSGSMQQAGAVPSMENAAISFVRRFAGGRDKVGLITYGGTYYVAYAPSINFKSAVPSVETLIGQIKSGGSTNIAQALWMAYQQLLTLNEPGAENVILLFTDGVPTAFTGLIDVSASPYCVDKTQKRGFVTEYSSHTAGIFVATATSISDVAETTLVANRNGCSFASNSSYMYRDVVRLPSADVYGNATTAGYKAVNLARPDLTSTVDAASANAADNAAYRIRSDANMRPLIYTIGLGGTSTYPPDQVLLHRIANDPASPTFNSTQPSGLFVWSPTTAQLESAFLRIASEILRIGQ
jgi:Flp pilus assembly protein TadG